MAGPRRLALAVAAAALGCAGCGTTEGLAVPHWTLEGEPAAPAATTAVRLPGHLPVADHAGRYVLRTRVELPARWHGQALDLVVADVPAVVQLAADGAPLALAEAPLFVGYRLRGPLSWRLPADATADGQVELRFEVEHRWTQSAWWSAAPTLVPAGERTPAATGVLLVNLYAALAALVGLVQLGLTSLLVYLVDRHRRAYLWFAIQLLTAAFYPASVLGMTQVAFGVYDTPLLAAALIAAIGASIYFTHEFFELGPPWRGWMALCGAAGVALLTCTGPFVATRYAGIITVAVVMVLTSYQLLVCSRLALRHPDRVTSRLQLASWLALALLMPVDVIHWLGLGAPLAGARPASIGLFLFAMCLSAILSRQHIMTLRREAAHVAAATARRAEVEALNVELRHQVAERSSQLFAALAIASGRVGPATSLAPGTLVQERYRVLGELGRGGMGTVYEVERLGDARHFALKLTHDQRGIAMARLAREALIAARIDHPNVVAVIDVGVVNSGFLYVVMELVPGTSLKAHRARFGDVPWALDALAQVASGLAALHAEGVVHRDLKPANLLITPTTPPLVKITDFGVSRPTAAWASESSDGSADEPAADAGPAALDDGSSTVDLDGRAEDPAAWAAREAAALEAAARAAALADPEPTAETRGGRTEERARLGAVTRTGFLVGTPAYIAPEAASGRGEPAAPVDIFAFGVIAFELLSGTRPFARPPAMTVLAGGPAPIAPSLATRWAGPPALVALLDRCLAVDPATRPRAAELAAALRAAVAATA